MTTPAALRYRKTNSKSYNAVLNRHPLGQIRLQTTWDRENDEKRLPNCLKSPPPKIGQLRNYEIRMVVLSSGWGH